MTLEAFYTHVYVVRIDVPEGTEAPSTEQIRRAIYQGTDAVTEDAIDVLPYSAKDTER